MEKKTLSRLETFALSRAREAVAFVNENFNQLIKDVVDAHGIPEADRASWQFSMDFTRIEHRPKAAKAKTRKEKSIK
jgi:predicted DNA binding CopG/RHH family protein